MTELLTVAEAAALLRTTAKGVYTLAERGALPGATRTVHALEPGEPGERRRDAGGFLWD